VSISAVVSGCGELHSARGVSCQSGAPSEILADHRELQRRHIQLVEHKLRRLYGTIDGQGCQALLTTEYQQWKNTVLRHFLNHSGDAAGARLLDVSLSDNVPRCRFPSQFPEDHHDASACRRPLVPAIEAFLPNYHLMYVQGNVNINPHEPVVRVDTRTKRGRELEEHEL
jgi:hypothetical protein